MNMDHLVTTPFAASMLLIRIAVGFSLSLYSDLLGALLALGAGMILFHRCQEIWRCQRIYFVCFYFHVTTILECCRKFQKCKPHRIVY